MKSSLQEAEQIINGERQDQYGKPEDSFRIIFVQGETNRLESYLEMTITEREEYNLNKSIADLYRHKAELAGRI